MADFIEREIKLHFNSVKEARAAVLAVGAKLNRTRQFQDDRLFDWPDGRLEKDHCALRVRNYGNTSYLTFKGPPLAKTIKAREELETTVDNASLLIVLLKRLGLEVRFRYQKYREEYKYQGVTLTIDETPIGTYVEIEGTEYEIFQAAKKMGRTKNDYILDSYHALFVSACEKAKVSPTNMILEKDKDADL
tara:strand:+ start:215 stop:787 length:573 start_codon:yes stop_codon:yes gene_type:complete